MRTRSKSRRSISSRTSTATRGRSRWRTSSSSPPRLGFDRFTSRKPWARENTFSWKSRWRPTRRGFAGCWLPPRRQRPRSSKWGWGCSGGIRPVTRKLSGASRMGPWEISCCCAHIGMAVHAMGLSGCPARQRCTTRFATGTLHPAFGGPHCGRQVHNLDVVNWIKGGHPVRGQGMGGRQVRNAKRHGQIFDHHFVEFEYADGTRMISQCRQIPGCGPTSPSMSWAAKAPQTCWPGGLLSRAPTPALLVQGGAPRCLSTGARRLV